MLREPAVAGAFYPDNPENLKVAIEDSFLSPFGVGKIPEDIKKFDGKDYPINIMAPHAGYIYSAPIASHSYYKIAEYGIPDVFIILSPNHTGFGSEISVFNKGEWKTPFGLVEVDNEFAEEIISDSEIASADFSAHVSEHAIEVQLPFLQYLSNNFKIVPIVMGTQSLITASDLSSSIVKAGEKSGKSYCIIASTDLSHFNTQERANEVDGFVLEDIEKMDELKLMEEIIQYNITMCGYGPVITTILSSKLTGKNSSEILAYGTSGDISKDFSNVVGYASGIFR